MPARRPFTPARRALALLVHAAALLGVLVLAAPARAAAPSVTTLPAITGTPRSGQTLSSSTGTWTGATPMSYARRWQRCDGAGGACTPLGATGATYQATDADVGSTLRVAVTATNADGTSVATSAASAVIAPKAPPVSTAPPVLSGTARDGGTLSTTTGTWTGTTPISYARRWLRCDGAGGSCTALTTTTTSLTLTAADVGSTLRVEVTATNADGTATSTSAASAVVEPMIPTLLGAPVLAGTAREGQVLTATTGRWKGTPTIAYAQRWLRCPAGGGACAAIAGATGASYRLTAADVGATIRAEVTATNAAGSAVATSAASATVTRGVPVDLVLPAVEGPLPRDGEVYAGTLGDWTGTAPFTFDRQWLRCSSTGTACAVISGEIAPEYAVRSADVGHTLRLRVTASNSQGITTVQSDPSPVIGASPPTNQVAPRVGGQTVDGELLSATTGSWTGTGPIAYTYQWERCDALGGTCAEVAGATAASYRLTADDVNARLRVRVGASSGGGGGVATSDQTAVVAAAPPVATAPPKVSGPATEGGTLTVAYGTWTGTPPIEPTVRWQRCDSAGDACEDVPGATGIDRELDAGDVGHTLRAVVTATNAAGSTSAASAPTAVVTSLPPANVVPPAITATELRDGRTLTATPGSWTGSRPVLYDYRWQRCPPKDACRDVPGATDATYLLQTADVGMAMRVVVRASNAAGQASLASSPTGTILPNPPSLVDVPTVSGVARDGETLTAADGTWTGLVPFTTAYRWWRCDAAGSNCGIVPGAVARLYPLVPADVGLTLRVQVLQSNAGGTTAALSAPSDLVRPAPPTLVVAPIVAGPTGVGRTLTAEHGAWNGTPELSYAYQWQRCAAGGDGCVDVPGATGSAYALTSVDGKASMRVVVSATNAAGSATATSQATGEILDTPPVNAAAPRIEAAGLVAQGTVLQARPGAWAGDRPLQLTYQWRRCDAQAAGCVDLPGATGETFTLAKDDVGRRLVVVVTATNAVGLAVKASEPTPVVLPEPPASALAPAVTVVGGALRDGAKLTATTGRWTGAAPITFTVAWVRCDRDGGACRTITGATGSTYALGPEDVGARVRARVTATNAATSVDRDSDATAVVGAAPPVVATKPAVISLDGKPRVGGRLRATPGTFTGTGPIDTALQWQRCAGKGTLACDDLPGATGPELVLGDADVGQRHRVVVTATNAGGALRVESTASEVVPQVAPAVAVAPALAGEPAREGTELRATTGRFTGSGPLDMAIQWERCKTPDAATCPKIPGATRDRYVLTTADVGSTVRVSVTASNTAGKATASSPASPEVAGVAPRNTELPAATLATTVKVGTVLTGAPGRWAGTAPVTFAYRWQRCDSLGRTCVDVPKAVKPTYALVGADVRAGRLRRALRVVVTATNVAGSAQAASALVTSKGPKIKAPTAPGASAQARRRAARARAARATSAALTAAGRLVVTVSCPAAARRGCPVSGAVSVAGARLRLAAPRLGAGRTRPVRIRLTGRQRATLRRARQVTVRATLAGVARRFAVPVPARLKR